MRLETINHPIAASLLTWTHLDKRAHPDCLVLADYLVAQGLAARDGEYLKIVGGGGGAGGSKGTTTVSGADKKVLDFRLQGASS